MKLKVFTILVVCFMTSNIYAADCYDLHDTDQVQKIQVGSNGVRMFSMHIHNYISGLVRRQGSTETSRSAQKLSYDIMINSMYLDSYIEDQQPIKVCHHFDLLNKEFNELSRLIDIISNDDPEIVSQFDFLQRFYDMLCEAVYSCSNDLITN